RRGRDDRMRARRPLRTRKARAPDDDGGWPRRPGREPCARGTRGSDRRRFARRERLRVQLNGDRRRRVARFMRRLFGSGGLPGPLAGASPRAETPNHDELPGDLRSVPVTNEHADTKDEASPPEPETKTKAVAGAQAQHGSLDDSATEHAAFEMAVYDDNDGVTVFTPSVALGIDNTSGATLRATYLVDV